LGAFAIINKDFGHAVFSYFQCIFENKFCNGRVERHFAIAKTLKQHHYKSGMTLI